MSLWWSEQLSPGADPVRRSTCPTRPPGARWLRAPRHVPGGVRRARLPTGSGLLDYRATRGVRHRAADGLATAVGSVADLHPATRRRSATATRTSRTTQWSTWSARRGGPAAHPDPAGLRGGRGGRPQRRHPARPTRSWSLGRATTAPSCSPTKRSDPGLVRFAGRRLHPGRHRRPTQDIVRNWLLSSESGSTGRRRRRPPAAGRRGRATGPATSRVPAARRAHL